MRVLFFAQLKDITGCAEMPLAGENLSADELWERLVAAHPGLAPFQGRLRLAKNLEYAGPDTRFGGADEVALIPPVSGG